MQILGGMSAIEKRQKFRFVNWERVSRYYGVVVTTDAEAHWQIDQREIPVITYNSLRWRFHRKDLRYPNRFWTTCVQRPWQDNEIRVETHGHVDIKVGVVAYRLPISLASVGPRRNLIPSGYRQHRHFQGRAFVYALSNSQALFPDFRGQTFDYALGGLPGSPEFSALADFRGEMRRNRNSRGHGTPGGNSRGQALKRA